MASEYVQLHASWLSNRKFKRLAHNLEVTPFLARAHVSHLWVNCLMQAPDGNLEDFEDFEIAEMAQWGGDAKQFVRALTASGLLDWSDGTEGAHPHFEVHDWSDYSGSIKAADRRRKDRERKRRQRGSARAVQSDASGRQSPRAGGLDSQPAVQRDGETCPADVPGETDDCHALTNKQNEQTKPTNEQTNKQAMTNLASVVVDVVDSVGTMIKAEDLEALVGDRLVRRHMSSEQMSKARELEPFTQAEVDGAFASARQQEPNRERFNFGYLLAIIRAQRMHGRISAPRLGVISGVDTARLKAKWQKLAPEGWRNTLGGSTARELEALNPSFERLAKACREAEEDDSDVWSVALMLLRANN